MTTPDTLQRRFACPEWSLGGAEVVWEHLTTAGGRFVELVPYRRLVFTYGWQDGRMGVPAGGTWVEISLTDTGGTTTLRLVHHGLPPDVVPDHQRGWVYFLDIPAHRTVVMCRWSTAVG